MVLQDNFKRDHLASILAVTATASALLLYWIQSRKDDPFDAFVKPRGRLPYLGN